MSTFKTAYDKSVEFQRIGNDMHLNITHKNGGNLYNVILDPTDAPEIALAVTDSGGIEPTFYAFPGELREPGMLVEMAAWCLNKAQSLTEAKAAAAAEEAARGKRRDELARELIESAHGPNATVGNYGLAADVVRTAIDRIIDTENELAKERAK